MLFSKAFIPTLREDPVEADAVSQKLLIRGGYIRKVASGIYEWLPLGLRVLKKVENIIREEMNAADGQEVWLPVVQPKELWQKTGRWAKYGKELLRFKDRKDAEFCLAPTAEEVMTDIVTSHLRSWRELPLMLYQFGTKFRDEIRPRFGIMRGREFYMWDAYSFHADDSDVDRYYEVMKAAYSKAFDRIGLTYRIVEAETGAIGGNFSHEFMVLADTGEDDLLFCNSCSYAANLERAECAPLEIANRKSQIANSPLSQDVHTPGAYSVDDVSKMLKIDKKQFVKTMFYWADNDQPVICLVRGDHALNEAKLKRVLGCEDLRLMDEKGYETLCGAPVGFCGPQDLIKRAKQSNPKARVIGDWMISGITDGVSGANRKDYHSVHLAFKRDFDAEGLFDLHTATTEDVCPRCKKSQLVAQKGIEVGHVFKLGTKYSKTMNTVYVDQNGKEHVCVMGTYGIGVSRIVAASCEQNHDEKGIIWPRGICPYEVEIVALDMHDERTSRVAHGLYQDFKSQGLEVILDDRDAHAGVKFNDADLIGAPVRVILGNRNLAKGQVEIKLRNQKTPKLVALDQAVVSVKLELANFAV